MRLEKKHFNQYKDFDDFFENKRMILRKTPDGGTVPQIEKSIVGVVKGLNKEKRSVTVVASTPIKDRIGDTIQQEGWLLDWYTKNPVVLQDHIYMVDFIAGVAARSWVEDGVLMEEHVFDDPSWNRASETIWPRILSGSARAVSVGFLPYEWEKIYDDDDKFVGYNFLQQEKLETSWVAVPANPEALMAYSPAKSELREPTGEPIRETGLANLREAVGSVESILRMNQALDRLRR